jgi:hypothetical protein
MDVQHTVNPVAARHGMARSVSAANRLLPKSLRPIGKARMKQGGLSGGTTGKVNTVRTSIVYAGAVPVFEIDTNNGDIYKMGRMVL